MNTWKLIKGIILAIICGGMGVYLLISLIASKSWLDFKEPTQVTEIRQLSEGAIVAFTTVITDTGKVSRYSDGSVDTYFYKGSIGGEPITLSIHHNFASQMRQQPLEQFQVIGKVIKIDAEKDILHIEILRNDYKNSAIGLLVMAVVFMGLGIITLCICVKRMKKV